MEIIISENKLKLPSDLQGVVRKHCHFNLCSVCTWYDVIE